MNQLKFYLPKIFLSFLLVFLLIFSEIALVVQNKALSEKTFSLVIEQQALDEKAYSALDIYFQSRSNSTGIPKKVYLEAIQQEELKTAILSSVEQAFAFLNGETETYSFSMDFTKLENSVNAFFNQYAEENNYQKDEAFYQKIQENLDEAEEKILYTADTFKFSTLNEHGWLEKLRSYLSIFRTGVIIICVMTIFIMGILLFLCRTTPKEIPYWLGLTGVISGLLTASPCVYVLRTNYFSSFVVKDPQIFAAVVGYLQYITGQLCTVTLITLIFGIIFLILFGILHAKTNS